MGFQALAIGYAIPKEFDAVVHSVFEAAVNLRLTADNTLLTVTAGEADLPQGIRVEAPAGFTFETLRAGERALCRDDSLRLGSLTIGLRGARRWKCDLPSLQADLTNPAVSAAWQEAWRALNRRQVEAKAEIIAENLFQADRAATSFTAEKAGKALRGLIEAARQRDAAMADSAVGALIGLGAGLTPSGDDLLVGCLAGLWSAVRNQNERARFVSQLGEIVVRRSSQTNEISRAFLYHAARGQVSSRLASLAEAICAAWQPGRVLAAAESAMQVGHTSGMDAVTGLLAGLAAWQPPRFIESRPRN